MQPKQMLGLTVFVIGAAIMVLELTAARLFAPFLGNSLFVWTSLIGVVLAFLSLGYWWGGLLADRKASIELLQKIILGAASLILALVIEERVILVYLARGIADLRLAAVLSSVALLALPSTLLGMVAPLAFRLSVSELNASGSTAGRLYALSTLGSIVGTFGAGFFLFSFCSTTETLFLLAFTLALLAFLLGPKKLLFPFTLFLLLLVGLYFLDSQYQEKVRDAGLIFRDTPYQRAMILDEKTSPPEQPKRYLITDPLGSQSSMYLHEPARLSARYSEFYNLAFAFVSAPTQALMLGGGAYSYPKYLEAQHPDLHLDVVEIDSGLTKIAEEFFSLKQSLIRDIHHEDARTFLSRTKKDYDIIFVDVFGTSPVIPFHLATKEFCQELNTRLSAKGVVLLNVISAVEGDSGKFFRALYKTYASVFAEVRVFLTDEPQAGARVQNIMLIARNPQAHTPECVLSAEQRALLGYEWTTPINLSDASILTDAFAPVEYLMLPVLKEMRLAEFEPKQDT